MSMFKKALTLIVAVELAACVYLLAYCHRPAQPKPTPIAPSDAACADYVARENQAWLESLAKLDRIKKDAGKK